MNRLVIYILRVLKKEEGVSQCDFTLSLFGYLSENKSEYSILRDLIPILGHPLLYKF